MHDVLVHHDEVARSASARGEVVLRRRHERERDPVLELRVNGVFVMDTAETTTEVELARAALAQVPAPRCVLVGGLGLGFTTHEVLADQRVERVVVAELEEALVGWFRDGTVGDAADRAQLGGRLELWTGAVQDAVVAAGDAAYDLVLLDVDNGPDFLVHEGNAELYRHPFLREVRRVLVPGGAVAVWSSSRSAALEAALAEVFGTTRTVGLPVRLQDRAEAYWLHLGGTEHA